MSQRGFVERLPIGPFRTRPHLTGAIAVGLLAGLALVLVPNPLRASTRAVLSWDAGCAWLIVSSLIGMVGRQRDAMKAQAAKQDEGGHIVLAFVLLAAAASLVAIAAELSSAKSQTDLARAASVGLAFATVAASWFVVQIVFALHYADKYYAAGNIAGEHRGGLNFPGDDDPDYWDFLHFSVVIGVASQTADVAFTSRVLRRIGTVHCVAAFTFNTVVLALTINLLAGLF